MAESSTFRELKREISPDDFVLDLGTKDGSNVSGLPGTVVGVDIKIRSTTAAEGVWFCLGDGRELPFRDDTFDYVICTQVLEHVPGHDRLIREASRVLDPEGTAYFTFPNRISIKQPHEEVPGWYSLLPKRLGTSLSPLLLDDRSREYYLTSSFPLSPVSARRHLHEHFGSVRFPMQLDPEALTGNPVLQKLLVYGNAVAMYPPFKWVGELLWPYSSYVCGLPRRNTLMC